MGQPKRGREPPDALLPIFTSTTRGFRQSEVGTIVSISLVDVGSNMCKSIGFAWFCWLEFCTV